MLTAAVEPPRPGLVLCSPELLFFASFGYFVPLRKNMIVIFRTADNRVLIVPAS